MDHLINEIEEILAPLPEWIAQFRDAKGRYRYHRDPQQPYCLYATLEGLSLADLLDKGCVSVKERKAALHFLRACQSAEDGYFRCPTCSALPEGVERACPESNSDGLTFKAAATLLLAGERPAHPLPEGNVLQDDVERGLKEIFLRTNPYGAGSQVWKKSGMYGLKTLAEGRDPMQDGYMRRIIEWLLASQDHETGLWFPRGDRRNGMNGLLKMRYGTFDLCGVEIPNPEKIVAAILTIPSPTTGRFGEACDDWNGVGLLADLGRRAPQFRDDILRIYQRIMPAMRAKRDPLHGGLTWGQGGDSYLKPTFINAVGLSAMKAFLRHDDAALDQIFFLRPVRRRLLG